MTDYIRIPPDSTGKKVLTKSHIIDADTCNVQVTHIADPITPTQLLYIDDKGAGYFRFTEGTPILDAHGIMATSNSRILGVYEHSIDSYDDLFVNVEANGGTSTYDEVAGNINLMVTSVSGSSIQRTTNRYHYNQIGVPLLIAIIVYCADVGKANNVRRWGYYDDNNGGFFELNETSLSFVLRSNITGMVIDTPIPQAYWNDPLDGNGSSGITIDITKLTKYWVDVVEGVAIRIGIYGSSGERLVALVVPISMQDPTTSIRYGSLPFRFENFNTGTTIGVSELNVSSAVIKIDGDANYTFWRYGGLECSGKEITHSNMPIMSVKSKTVLQNGNKNIINVFPEDLCIYCEGGPFRLDIVSHYEGNALLTISGSSPTWGIDNYSTLLGDSDATYIDTENDDYWIMKTLYFPVGVTNMNLSYMYELNDEGILLSGDGIYSVICSFVGTNLTGANAIVTIALSTRELW